MEFLELLHYFRTIFRIRDTEPTARGIQNFASCIAATDERIYHERNEEFALQVLLVLRVAQESLEVLATICEIVGGKSPEVHGHRCRIRNTHPSLAIVVKILYNAIKALNLCALNNAGKELLVVGLADAATSPP